MTRTETSQRRVRAGNRLRVLQRTGLVIALLLLPPGCGDDNETVDNRQQDPPAESGQRCCQENKKPVENQQNQGAEVMEAELTTEQLRRRYVEGTGGSFDQNRDAFIADLRRRYGGIDASLWRGPEAYEHLRRFGELMKEWNPLGCSADDLKSIAGEPTKEVPLTDKGYDPGSYRVLTYRFHGDGMVHARWEFTVSGKTIIEVRYIPGD